MTINKKIRAKSGQALIEYLFIFAFMTFVTINMVKGLRATLIESVGFLGFELTEQFTVGVCKRNCFYSGFKNRETR
jgi:hypothetical protein